MTKFRHILVSAVCALAFCLVAQPAVAAADVEVGDFETSLSSNQAGESADFNLKFTVDQVDPADPNSRPTGVIKEQQIDLPEGFLADPTKAVACPMARITSQGIAPCPVGSVVGVAFLTLFNPAQGAALGPFTVRVHRLETYPGEVAAFGFTTLAAYAVRLSITVDPSNGYRIRVSSLNQQAGLPLVEADVTMWGVPAEHQGPGPFTQAGFPETFGGPLPASVRRERFMSVPTRCDKPLVTSMRLASWQFRTLLAPVNSEIAAPTGCENLNFSPWLEVKPAVAQAATPSGYQVTLQLGQNDDPATPRTANLKDAVVTLPRGVAISPSVANGLEACTDAQLAINSKADETCPPASKIGDVTLESPVLDHPVSGAVYVGSQLSNDPASGNMFRIFLTATDSGLKIKLRGQISVDPQTGQITTRFLENPDLPVKKLTLSFKGGDRAPLTTPPSCGEYATNSSFTSWGGQSSQTSSSFAIDQGCGEQGFKPGFSAGTANPIGGSYSPFTLRVTRPDGQQNVSTIAATLPEGVLAKLAGVPLCGDADAVTGNCPADSQVGTTTVAAGGGASPVYVPQPGHPATGVYLAGPYKGAPYSLVVKVPAQAGPFDLGTVAVRNALYVDPTSAQVSAKSDPLPQVLAGVPISYRDIRVEVNKPGFTINPTSCDPMEVKGVIGSANGTNTSVSDRFQVASCEALRFKPNLKLSVKGPTHRNAHPRFKAVLTMPKGANIQKAQVTLPKTELLENAHIRTICTRVQYAAGAGGGAECPKASIYGKARAWSPLLDKPLEGPVYLRSSNHQLPDLVASLDGQIHIDLVGRIDAVHARIRNTFEGVPDAPVSRFVLEMQGGKKGLLANNTELCKTTPKAAVKFDAHSGKLADSNPVMRAQCGKKAKKRSAKHRR